ncbi:TPA: hypothetical protein RG862_003560 [Enterobacter ludwigii]|nr:hypothetical protein [Enterobacter ludwigii]
MLIRIITILFFSGMTFLLTSCVSAEQQHQLNTDKCKSYGYKEHTKSFSDCMKDVDFHNDEKDEREDDRSFARDHTFFEHP